MPDKDTQKNEEEKNEDESMHNDKDDIDNEDELELEGKDIQEMVDFITVDTNLQENRANALGHKVVKPLPWRKRALGIS